jgi:hypothetical protein
MSFCISNVDWFASALLGGIAKVAFEKFPIFEIVSSEVFGINIFSGTEGLLMSVKLVQFDYDTSLAK